MSEHTQGQDEETSGRSWYGLTAGNRSGIKGNGEPGSSPAAGILRLALGAGERGASFPVFPALWLGRRGLVRSRPLLLAVRGVSPLKAFGLDGGGFTGIVGILYWIVTVVVQYGRLPLWSESPSCSFWRLTWGCISPFFRDFWFVSEAGNLRCDKRPLLWTSLEFVKSPPAERIPWSNLGASQYPNLAFIQMAEFTRT
jgi:apolipoprotein N-acyltransferase